MTAIEALLCSFCGKPSTEVGRLVAGPGVYICDECVALAASVVEGTSDDPERRRAPVWGALSDEEMLAHIPRVAAHIDEAEADLRSWVRELRRRGVTWVRLGEALGTTRQSAWERFSGEE
ncbi:ClpX C4-type zinc finger protein [Actinocorallia herbida]|uniref:ClpX C4-type zinc finger protein n=1 Tax=Actinocorallia herbida TaxID=58109 RepID=A0A3N1CYT6_9ACTN|nr:ClpX C4-type zinc finger protein [Actinocorallia herbida]ROO85958.1 ClpX C4-type zinc finger protein [Actinocorallia herbida]